MEEYFLRFYEYNHWANKTLNDSVINKNDIPPDAINYFSHLIIAEKTWMERIKGDDSTTNFWQNLSKEDFANIIEENHIKYIDFINSLEESKFEDKIKYRNSKGIEFNTSVKNILTHVATHSAYHRGQVNSAIRKAGGEPANVDFIIYTRLK